MKPFRECADTLSIDGSKSLFQGRILVVWSKEKDDTGNLFVEEGISDEAPVEVLIDEGSDSDNNINRSDCIHIDLQYT